MRLITLLALLSFAPLVGCSDEPEAPVVTPEIREQQDKGQQAVDQEEKQEMMKNAKQRNGR